MPEKRSECGARGRIMRSAPGRPWGTVDRQKDRSARSALNRRQAEAGKTPAARVSGNPGLGLSHGGGSRGECRGGAPEGGRAPFGAQPRSGIDRRQRCWCCAAMVGMRLSALRLPFFAGGELFFGAWWLGRARTPCAPRERFCFSARWGFTSPRRAPGRGQGREAD